MDEDDDGERWAEFAKREGVEDTVRNRTCYDLAVFMAKAYIRQADEVSEGRSVPTLVMIPLYSKVLQQWTAWIAIVFPAGLRVPIVMIGQEDMQDTLQMGCGPNCTGECKRVQTVEEAGQPALPAPKPETTDSGGFTHTVESLLSDPEFTESFMRLDGLFTKDSERREGDGKG